MSTNCKITVKLACVLALWLLWKHTASVSYCMIFWTCTIVYGVKVAMKNKAFGSFLILIGITCNALVTEVNGGIMPAVGMPITFRPASPIWGMATGKHWLFLADQARLDYFSIGDLLALTGVVFLIFSFVMTKRIAR